MFELVFLVLLILKLTGNFDKSWHVVFSPLYIAAVIYLILCLVVFAPLIIVTVAALFAL